MKDLNGLIKDVERDLVVNLTLGIRFGRLNKKEARDIAREFMAGFAFKDEEELFMKMNILSEKYRLARKIYIKYAPTFAIDKDKRKIEAMRSFMRQNDIESAIRAAKGGV